MPRNRNRLAAAVAVAAIAGGGAGAGIVALAHDSGNTAHDAATASSNVSNIANGSLSVAAIAKTSIPSVVEIDSTSTSNDSPFPGSGGSTQAAEGTGFVYDTKGDIVTNDHVVSGANSLTVTSAPWIRAGLEAPIGRNSPSPLPSSFSAPG